LRNSRIIVFSLVLGIILTMASLVSSIHENIPDAATTKYGFPSVWLFHQISSIAGAVDIWSVQWALLVIDFILWFIISAAIVYVLNRHRKSAHLE
jgi:hypothetical protein